MFVSIKNKNIKIYLNMLGQLKFNADDLRVSGRQSGRVAVIFVASTVNQEVQRTKTHHAEARFGALHLLIFLPFWLQILPPLKRLVVRPVNDI